MATTLWNLDPIWDRVRDVASDRDKQKASYKSTKNWSRHSPHFIGLLGEWMFYAETGIRVDDSLRASGDRGADFTVDGRKYDIKTTVHYRDPHLKQYRSPKRWVDYYILAAVLIPNRHGRIVGWADESSLRCADLVNYGYGLQLSIPGNKLIQGMPPWLPVNRRTKT